MNPHVLDDALGLDFEEDGQGELTADEFAWAHIIDWERLFAGGPPEVDWLVKPVLERGTVNVWYAPPESWKSLLAQEMSACLVAGQPVFGNPASDPVTVVYLDIENPEGAIHERFLAFGCTADDLKRLVYCSFPDLPPLDTLAGGLALLKLVERVGADLVIIDTTARVIHGKENDADTWHDMYRYTLMPLKQRGLTVLRLDHPGKAVEKGQRGSSAKLGDPDTVWFLDKKPGDRAVLLDRDKSRTGHGQPALYLRRRFEPLRHEPDSSSGLPPRMDAMISELDRLAAPPGITNKDARTLLREAGNAVRNEDLAQALRLRRERDNVTGNTQVSDREHDGNAGERGVWR